MIGRLARIAFLLAAVWLYAGLALSSGGSGVFAGLAVCAAALLAWSVYRLATGRPAR